jgi:hypothetical protein
MKPSSALAVLTLLFTAMQIAEASFDLADTVHTHMVQFSPEPLQVRNCEVYR